MKVEIRNDGVLKVTAESSTEGYALRKWIQESGKPIPSDVDGINTLAIPLSKISIFWTNPSF